MREGLTKGARLFIALLASMLAAGCAGPVGSLPPTPTAGTEVSLAGEVIFYDWEGDMPEPILEAFTQEYGVDVIYRTYESQVEALDNLRAGEVYDLVVFDSRFLPSLIEEGLLVEIDYQNVPHFRNISPNFRNLVYDPGNKYSVPFNWGTTGLVVRSDLLEEPVDAWADLWDARYAGRIALWRGERRELIGLALRSLGYSANSEESQQLEEALDRLTQLCQNAFFLEDYDVYTSVPLLVSGEVVIAEGWSYDAVEGREYNPDIHYVLPEDGAMLWGDHFVIPANSHNKYTAEVFLNFLLRPGISAEVANRNLYATANEAALSFVNQDVLNDPAIFPPNEDLENAEIILPLSPEGERLYADVWERLMAACQ